MDLFRQKIANPNNILPIDGMVKYYGVVIPIDEADKFYHKLLSDVAWKHDEAIILGKHIKTKRKAAWYADSPFEYTYSKITKKALPWIRVLQELKDIVEGQSNEKFNSCLLNLYHNGSESMAWHSDSEKDLKKHGAIGSMSFGAERKFSFRHKKTKQKSAVILEHGSLLVMEGTTQSFWQHCLPPMKKIIEPRINLTFRTIVKDR